MSDSRGGCQLAAVPPTLTVAQATGRGFTGLTHPRRQAPEVLVPGGAGRAPVPRGAGAACRTGGGRRIYGRHRTPGLTGLVQPVPVPGNTSGPRSATFVAACAEPDGAARLPVPLVPRRGRRPGALCSPPWQPGALCSPPWQPGALCSPPAGQGSYFTPAVWALSPAFGPGALSFPSPGPCALLPTEPLCCGRRGSCPTMLSLAGSCRTVLSDDAFLSRRESWRRFVRSNGERSDRYCVEA